MVAEAGIGRLLTDGERNGWPRGALRSAFLVDARLGLTAWHCIADIGGTDARLWLRLRPRHPTQQFVDVPVRYADHDRELDTALLNVDADAESADFLSSVALPLSRDVEAYDDVRVSGFPRRNPSVHAVPLIGKVQSADALIGRRPAIQVHVLSFAARYAEWPDGMSGGPLLRRMPDRTERVVGVVVSYPRAGEEEGALGGSVICRRIAEMGDRFPVLNALIRDDHDAVLDGLDGDEPARSHDGPPDEGNAAHGQASILPQWQQKQASRWLLEALEHIRAGRLRRAESSLARMGEIQDGLTAKLRRLYLYDAACVESLKAGNETNLEIKQKLLDNGLTLLLKWLDAVIDEAWEDGLDPYNEVYRMSRDSDLYSLLALRGDLVLDGVAAEFREAFSEQLPTRWPKTGRKSAGSNGGGGGGCFPPGSRVHTPQGTTPIERIREGDEVLSIDHENGFRVVHARVTAVHCRRATRRVIIDGHLETTPTQPVCLDDGRYVPAGELKVGSRLRTADSSEWTVRHISTVAERFEVYSLTTDHESHNYVVSGIICHNFPEKLSG